MLLNFLHFHFCRSHGGKRLLWLSSWEFPLLLSAVLWPSMMDIGVYPPCLMCIVDCNNQFFFSARKCWLFFPSLFRGNTSHCFAHCSCGYLPANLIQAQRDYFGAHTYALLSQPTVFVHTNWTGHGGNTSASTYNAWRNYCVYGYAILFV